MSTNAASGGRVDVLEHVRGDPDQIRLQLAPVPVAEHGAELTRGGTERLTKQVVALGDELHVGVLDAVVHHLDEVPRAVGTDVGATRRAVHLGSDGLEQRPHRRVGLVGPSGHDARPLQGADLPTRDAGADEVEAPVAEGRLPSPGVDEVGVATVEDHVPWLEVCGEVVDDCVGRWSRLHHDDNPAGRFQGTDEVLGARRRHEVALVAVGSHQCVGAGLRAVVERHGVAVAGEVAGQVAAHDGQPGHADVGLHTRGP